jgi:hypothetical protein
MNQLQNLQSNKTNINLRVLYHSLTDKDVYKIYDDASILYYVDQACPSHK